MGNRPRNFKLVDQQLPIADDAGGCNDANFVGFEVPIPANQGGENACARSVEDLGSQCTSVFGWERFSNQLYVATDGTVAPASAIIAGDYTPVSREAEFPAGGGRDLVLSFAECLASWWGGVGWGWVTVKIMVMYDHALKTKDPRIPPLLL